MPDRRTALRHSRRTGRLGRSAWRLAAGLLLALVLSSAYAAKARIVHYDVSGDTAAELRQQIHEKGPLDGGKRFDAHTVWHVKWNYRYQPTPTGCKFLEVDVAVSGTILLPHWVDADTAPKDLVQAWDHYVAALRRHENGHYAHGVSAANDIKALAKSFDATGTCSEMVGKFNGKARAIVRKYEQKDVAYDRATDHGRTQGVVFP